MFMEKWVSKVFWSNTHSAQIRRKNKMVCFQFFNQPTFPELLQVFDVDVSVSPRRNLCDCYKFLPSGAVLLQ